MERIRPATVSKRSFGRSSALSCLWASKVRPGSTRAKTPSAAGSPASTPGARATSTARPSRSGGMTARLVRSPAVPRSSSSAQRARRSKAACSAAEKVVFMGADESLEEPNGVAEELQSVALCFQPLARPAGVLSGQHMAFRVRHQAEYPAGGVANTGHVALRAVGVDRVSATLPLGVGVAQDDLPRLPQPHQNPLLAADEPALAMSDGDVDSLNPL